MKRSRLFALALLLVFGVGFAPTIAEADCPIPMLMWGTAGGTAGQFLQPFGIEVGADGYVYVADQLNSRVQVFTESGDPVTSWAVPPGPNGLSYPTGVCVRDGVVWVSSNQGQVVTRWTTTGTLLGHASGPPWGWKYPTAIATNSAGDVFVCNSYYSEVIHLSPSGDYLGWFATGIEPYGIAIDGADNIYVGLYGGHAVFKHSPSGAFVSSFGSYGNGPGQFYAAEGLAFDAVGDLYVCDTGNDRVQKFHPDGTLVCSFGSSGSALGQLDAPSDIAVASNGEVFVCEYVNNRVQRFTLGVVPAARASWGSLKSRYR